MAFNLRWYSIRNYVVFKIFKAVLQKHIPQGLSFTAGLPGRDYNFQEHICPTSDLRPNIVVWSEGKRLIWLFELTVCSEFNTEDVVARKDQKYNDL